MYAQWGLFILAYAEACNGKFAVPLSDGDVAKTARSVSKFCWGQPELRASGGPGEMGQRGAASPVPAGGDGAPRKVVDRNRVILSMHEDGMGIRAIGREIDLSPSQVSRVVGSPVLHDPITSSGGGVGVGSVMLGQSQDDEIRNGCAADFKTKIVENSPKNSLIQ